MTTMMSLAKLYYFTFQFCPAVPLIYGLKNFKLLDHPLRCFLLYLSVSLGLTIIMTVLALGGHNTLWLTNLSLPVYAAIILWTFSLWVSKENAKKILRLTAIPFAILWIVEISVTGEYFKFTTYSGPVLDIILVTGSLYVIYDVSSNAEVLLTELPLFWICTGVLFTFGGIFVISLLSPPLLNLPAEEFRKILLFQPVLNLIVHLLYIIGYILQCRN